MDNFFKEIPPAEDKVYTVTEFNQEVNQLLNEFRVTIQGEVSGYKVIQNKYLRFDIKDQTSVLSCFLSLWQLNVQIEDGMEIKVRGRPGIYLPQGRYTFRVEWLEPVGAGALKRAFELTKAKLEKEGLFDPKFKKTLPRFPQTIGLITSTDAAAYSDVLKILNARWGGLAVFVYDVLVQGPQSPAQIVKALDHFNKFYPVDLIILTRGGGSLEDLQPFNAESVCRAVFASKIPIICGVGHERDVVLAELVADKRASTPTNAAELAVPDKLEVLSQLHSYRQQLGRELSQKIQTELGAISNFLDRLNSIILSHLNRFQDTRYHLSLAFEKFKQSLTNYQQDLKNKLSLLKNLNPVGILKRGYSITYTEGGQLIRAASQVSQGQKIISRLSQGKIISRVSDRLANKNL